MEATGSISSFDDLWDDDSPKPAGSSTAPVAGNSIATGWTSSETDSPVAAVAGVLLLCTLPQHTLSVVVCCS